MIKKKMKISIKGKATVRNEKGSLINGTALRKFHGASDDAVFSDYFHKAMPEHMLAGVQQQPLIDAGVTGGTLEFEYNANNKTLFSVTTYDTPRKLTKDEEKILVEYTQGQWSDGVGEGFEQYETRGAFISAWHHGQKVTVSYN